VAVDRHQQPLLCVLRQDLVGLLLEAQETARDRRLHVIVASDQTASTTRTAHRASAPLLLDHPTTSNARSSSQQSFKHDAAVHDEVDRNVDFRPEQEPECLCLRDRARESVEDEAASSNVGAGQPFREDSDDELVGHEVAVLHETLDRAPKLRVPCNRVAKQCTRRQVRKTETFREVLALCALPRARSAKYDDPRDATRKGVGGCFGIC
jgi:hypothetical protein